MQMPGRFGTTRVPRPGPRREKLIHRPARLVPCSMTTATPSGPRIQIWRRDVVLIQRPRVLRASGSLAMLTTGCDRRRDRGATRFADSKPADAADSDGRGRHIDSKTLFNGLLDQGRLNSPKGGPIALAPEGGGQMAVERTAHPALAPRRAAPSTLSAETGGNCRTLTLWL
jgi:hypothetical protein